MKKNSAYKIIIGLALLVFYTLFLLNINNSPQKALADNGNDPELNRFIENYNVLKENWYYYSGDKEVIDAATNAMTSSNKKDAYTTYIASDQSQAYFESMESSYVGIGIQYTQYGEYPMVINVFDNSPAAKAKMSIGDLIIKVDDKDIKDMKADEIRKLVIGKPDTKVKITINRNSEIIDLDIIRQPIESSVNYHVENNIGYLKIAQFSNTTANETKVALESFQEQGITNIIIDLRNNPGGFLTSVVDVADLFLKSNEIVLSAKDVKGKIVDSKTSNNQAFDFNIKILVNKNTASAAEVLTAALNEHLGSEILGQTTFGKGIMQAHFEYKDKAIIKYTNAEWLTPKGNQINEVG
ncbi:MAG: S41 family peptidase, partial [Bacilli bacterium]